MNDNTPQPLDQWTNSPFMGQQVGNFKNFILTHYLAIFSTSTVAQGQSQCASNIKSNSQPFHSKWVDPPNPEIQQLWVRSKLKITTWVQHSIDSHPFPSMSISHPIPWDMIFLKFDLENPRSKSWVRWTLKVTTWIPYSIDSHSFCSISIGHPIPEIWLFQNWHWKSKVKVMVEVKVESHKVGA